MNKNERDAIRRLMRHVGDASKGHRIEKRRFVRAKVEGYIIAGIKSDLASNLMRVLFISFGGALLESVVALEKGQIVNLSMHLPLFSRPISIKAKVARVLPGVSSVDNSRSYFHIGVQFLEISRSDNKKLTETVTTLINTGNDFLSKSLNTTIVGNISPEHYYSLLRKKYFNHTIRTLIYLMDSIDRFAFRHSENVVKHVTRIAKKLRLGRYEILKIKIAALMHDLGKFKIEKNILYKTGKLTEREWEKVKRHPIVSAAMMNETGILNEISEVVRHHHARFAGGGYPDAQKIGKEIPFGSRIIAVADSYDAMVTKRVYREKRMTQKEAMYEIERCSGTQFDPRIVTAFT